MMAAGATGVAADEKEREEDLAAGELMPPAASGGVAGGDDGGRVDLKLKLRAEMETNLKAIKKKSSNPLQELNLFPSAGGRTRPEAAAAMPCTYQSVCTIEKVRNALERLERESRNSMAPSDGSPSSSLTSSSNKHRREGDEERGEDCESKSGAMLAAACSKCLFYVLISMENPLCPHCGALVPAPTTAKRPRIDLNISIF